MSDTLKLHQYHCRQCDDKWIAPASEHNAWWQSLADSLGGFVPWTKASQWLCQNTDYDERTRKSILLHLNLVQDSCHYCDSKLIVRGVTECPRCKSLNFNFLIGDATK